MILAFLCVAFMLVPSFGLPAINENVKDVLGWKDVKEQPLVQPAVNAPEGRYVVETNPVVQINQEDVLLKSAQNEENNNVIHTDQHVGTNKDQVPNIVPKEKAKPLRSSHLFNPVPIGRYAVDVEAPLPNDILPNQYPQDVQQDTAQEKRLDTKVEAVKVGAGEGVGLKNVGVNKLLQLPENIQEKYFPFQRDSVGRAQANLQSNMLRMRGEDINDEPDDQNHAKLNELPLMQNKIESSNAAFVPNNAPNDAFVIDNAPNNHADTAKEILNGILSDDFAQPNVNAETKLKFVAERNIANSNKHLSDQLVQAKPLNEPLFELDQNKDQNSPNVAGVPKVVNNTYHKILVGNKNTDNIGQNKELHGFLDSYDAAKEKEMQGLQAQGINVLPTIDNRLVAQASQQGIKKEQNANAQQNSWNFNAKPDDGNPDAPGIQYQNGWVQNNAVNAENNNVPYFRPPTTKPPSSKKPNRRPKKSERKDVIWSPEYHSYSLKASVDTRFRIRYAPSPLEGSPWPMPQSYNVDSVQYTIYPQFFTFHTAGESCDILDYYILRVRRNMFGDDSEEQDWPHAGSPLFGAQVLRTVNVTVLRECDAYPYLDMDESYDLEVRQSGAIIMAREVWGAIRGLETFSQIVYQNIDGVFVVNKTLVHDFPRFKHRGLLLDTSRHYLNKDTILLNLEAMAQNKMNVLHWHIVDEQSFPFVSHTFPNLTKEGAYDADHVYTHEDVQEIIREARVRGIRVIPEFDTPGHTFAWGLGQDNLLTPCYDWNGEPNGFFGPINPILKSTYKFLEGLFKEVYDVFVDKYVHLGGDEVPLGCWNTNPYIRRFMGRNELYDVKDLLNVYTKKLVDIVEDIGSTRPQGTGYIVWQEVFDDGVKLRPDAIVQVWKGNAWDIDRVTSKGLRVLFSSCWYIDYISYGQDWDKYYLCNQLLRDLDIYNVRNQSLIMGGDVCMWAEFVDDEAILPRVWPRTSAAAERLWSAKTSADAMEAGPRIEEQRCRMKRRGIPIGVLSGPGFCRRYKQPETQWGAAGAAAAASDGNRTANLNSFFKWPLAAPPADLPGVATAAKRIVNSKVMYSANVNSLYVFPTLLIVCIICLTVIVATTRRDTPASSLLALIVMPLRSTSRRGFRGLLYVFMVFALVWCLWTAPIWLHVWESSEKHRNLQQ